MLRRGLGSHLLHFESLFSERASIPVFCESFGGTVSMDSILSVFLSGKEQKKNSPVAVVSE